MEKEEFLKLLPRLIRENDEVKGAIISALSGVVSTKEDIEKIIEHSDKRFEAMDKRFEAMDKRFEALIMQMSRGFEEVKAEIKKVRVMTSSIGDRSGKALEKTIIELLNNKLIQENIQANKIYNEPLIDKEGILFPKNYSTDIDVLIEGRKTILIDMKYHSDNRKIADFLRRAELYAKTKNPYDQLVIITLEIKKRYFDYANQQQIKVIAGEVIE
ncbi:MAG: hypothetical protein ACTSRI_19785 [Promethearchaeota archaeon]